MMKIGEALEDTLRNFFKKNQNLPLPHGQFTKMKADVYADAVRNGINPELIESSIENTVKHWIEEGLCTIHDTIAGDITLTNKGYKYFCQ